MNDLTTLLHLAERINAEHDQAGAALKAGLLHARSAGDLLLQAKEQLPHGQWLPWLEANVRFSDRTAQAYMRVARRWMELEKAQGLADLTFEGGLKLLAAPAEVVLPAESTEADYGDPRAWLAAYATERGSPPDPSLIPDVGCRLVLTYRQPGGEYQETLFIDPADPGGHYYFVTMVASFGEDKHGHLCGHKKAVLDVCLPYAIRYLGAERIVSLGEREQEPAYLPHGTINPMLFDNMAEYLASFEEGAA
jgi:hypothetical protein